MDTQKLLFEAIVAQKPSIQRLAGFVQNDIDSMLADGFIDKTDIQESIVDMELEFNTVIQTLTELKSRVKVCLESYLK